MTAHRIANRPLSRALRMAVAGAASVALVAGGVGTASAEEAPAPPPQPAAVGEVSDLGVAMSSINVRLSAVGELADGTPVGYLFSDGNPVSLEVVDLRTGELLDQHRIEPYTVASSIAVAEDGTVYLSVRAPNDATLWKYSPDTKQLVQIATGIAEEEMLRTLDIDGDTLYGATYPDATVFAMDLDTEEITEFGRIAPEGDYAWGLDAEDGEVWVGAGTPAQLTTLDPATGTTQPLELPEGVAEGGDFIQRIETYGEDLRAVSHRAIDGASAHLHDSTGWIGTLEASGMWGYTEEIADGAFYYLSTDQDDPLWSFDVETRSAAPVDLSTSAIAAELGGTSQIFLAELGTDDFPGTSVVGIRTDGQIWRHNLETGHGDVVATEIEGAPVTTMSMAEGGDGQLYVGAYLSSGVMARIEPESGEITQLEGPEQADAITAHDGDTFIGTYPEARVHQADGGAEWEWGTNPRQVLELGRAASGQDRPRHMISAGDHVAIATIPNYGELGGALTLLDPQTGEHETHRGFIPDQSVTDLAYTDGTIYSGTSIHGALDSTPTAETAEVFAWDVQDGLQASTPIPGAEIIHSLTLDSAGSLWAMADTGALVQLDPGTLEILRTIETGIVHGNVWGSAGALDLHPENGLLYGSGGNSLFSLDPESGEINVLVERGVKLSTIAGSEIYFADDTNVYRYSLAAGPTCDQEITGEHRGALTVDEGTTCLTGADLRGPLTVTDGANLLVTDSALRGPVTAEGAAMVSISDSTIIGPVSITGSTAAVALNDTTVHGPLSCTENAVPPAGEGNAVRGPATGQCAGLG